MEIIVMQLAHLNFGLSKSIMNFAVRWLNSELCNYELVRQEMK